MKLSISTVANQMEYTEADDSDLQYLALPYQMRYLDGDEVGRRLQPWPGGYTNLPKEYSYGTPYYYWFKNVHSKLRAAPDTHLGLTFGLWPIPSSTGKVIHISGYGRPKTLSEDAHEPEIQPEWDDALVYYAVSRMYSMVSHLNAAWANKAVFFMSEFERTIGEANEFMINQSDEPIEIEDIYHQMDSGAYY